MPRQITWSLHTETSKTTSFSTGTITPALNFLGNYWDINVQNGNLSPSDYRWFDVYPRKAGSKRPHEEPNRLRNTFYTPVASAMESAPEAEFGCHVAKRSWYDFRPDSWLIP